MSAYSIERQAVYSYNKFMNKTVFYFEMRERRKKEKRIIIAL